MSEDADDQEIRELKRVVGHQRVLECRDCGVRGSMSRVKSQRDCALTDGDRGVQHVTEKEVEHKVEECVGELADLLQRRPDYGEAGGDDVLSSRYRLPRSSAFQDEPWQRTNDCETSDQSLLYGRDFATYPRHHQSTR